MNIKVTAFTVSEKSSNIFFRVRPLVKSALQKNNFFYFSIKAHIVGTQKIKLIFFYQPMRVVLLSKHLKWSYGGPRFDACRAF